MEFLGYSLGGSVTIFAISQLFYWSVCRRIINPTRYIYSSFMAYGVYSLISIYNLGGNNWANIFENFFTSMLQFSGALVLCLVFYWLYFVYESTTKKK